MGQEPQKTEIPTKMPTVCFPKRIAPMELTPPLNKCGYCDLSGASLVEIEEGRGIIACAAHSREANRDNKAFLHKKKVALLDDARAACPAFFAALAARPFRIKRSDGSFDAGWRFVPTVYISIPSRTDSRWCIVAEKTDYRGSRMTKNIPIDHFGMTGLFLDGIPYAVVADVLEALNAGIYCSEALLHDIAVSKS